MVPKSSEPAPNSPNGFGCQVVSERKPEAELRDRRRGAVDDLVADQDQSDRDASRAARAQIAVQTAVADPVERASQVAPSGRVRHRGRRREPG